MAIETRPQLADLVRADEVHRRVYTDPDLFAAELRRIFARTWVCVGHESEVPNPGDFKTDEIARQPILMTRHVDGQVHVLLNACRHRGALVCLEPYGTTRELRCLYHGWTYTNNGALVSVPRLASFEGGIRPSDYGLLPLPRVDSYRGFVFASLSPDGPSLAEHLGRATVYLDLLVDRAPAGTIQALKPVKYEYPGNWKLQVENYGDNYHPAMLHEAALSVDRELDAARGLSGPAGPPKYHVIERSFGYGHAMNQYAPEVRGWRDAFDDDEYRVALARRHGAERAAALAELDIHISIYPNLLLHSRMNHYRLVKPLAVDHTEVHTYPCKLVGAPDRVNAAMVRRTSEHVSPLGKIQMDDMKAFDCVQQGLQVQALEWTPLKLRGQDEHLNADGEWECFGPSEMMQRAQYREWARLMAED